MESIRRIARTHPMVLIDVATINPFDDTHARTVFDAGSDRRVPAFLRTGKTAQEVRTHREYLSASVRHELNRCGSTVIRADSKRTHVPRIRSDGIRFPGPLHAQSAESPVRTHPGRQGMIITLSDNGFDTMDPIHIETGLGIVIAVCLAIAAALVILVVWLSRPNRKPTKKANHGRHDAATGTSVWHERIDDVVARHAKGDLTRENAFALLAATQWDFAPQPPAAMCAAKRSPILEATPRTTGNQHGLTLLRQTIEALYPPEFADAERNHTAREATVEQAGEWVANLVERWR